MVLEESTISMSRMFVFQTISGKDLVPEQKNKMEEGGTYFQCRSSDDYEEQAGREQNAQKSTGKTIKFLLIQFSHHFVYQFPGSKNKHDGKSLNTVYRKYPEQ